MDGTQTLNNIHNQPDGMNVNTPVICLTADAVSGARNPVEKVAIQKSMDNNANDKPSENISGLENFYHNTEGLHYSDVVKYCSNEAIFAKTLHTFYRAIEANSDESVKIIEQCTPGLLADYRSYREKLASLYEPLKNSRTALILIL